MEGGRSGRDRNETQENQESNGGDNLQDQQNVPSPFPQQPDPMVFVNDVLTLDAAQNHANDIFFGHEESNSLQRTIDILDAAMAIAQDVPSRMETRVEEAASTRPCTRRGCTSPQCPHKRRQSQDHEGGADDHQALQ